MKIGKYIRYGAAGVLFAGSSLAPEVAPFLAPEAIPFIPAGVGVATVLGGLLVGPDVWTAWRARRRDKGYAEFEGLLVRAISEAYDIPVDVLNNSPGILNGYSSTQKMAAMFKKYGRVKRWPVSAPPDIPVLHSEEIDYPPTPPCKVPRSKPWDVGDPALDIADFIEPEYPKTAERIRNNIEYLNAPVGRLPR